MKCFSNLIDRSVPEARRGRGRILLRKRAGERENSAQEARAFVCFVLKAGKQCGL